jgi:hypothetical protein
MLEPPPAPLDAFHTPDWQYAAWISGHHATHVLDVLYTDPSNAE